MTKSGGTSGPHRAITRRDALKIGGAALLGLAMPSVFGADQPPAPSPSDKKALINIWLAGGPSHLDLFDLKPEAPIEIRGEFNPIATNVDGIRITELMPRLAKLADKYALVRSVVGAYGEHNGHSNRSGYPQAELASIGGFPPVGSVAAKLLGIRGSTPPYVYLAEDFFRGDARPGFLGPAYRPFIPSGPGLADLRLKGVGASRIHDRGQLLAELDHLPRDFDGSGAMAAMDEFQRSAADVVTMGKVANALDLRQEPPQGRERYHLPGPYKYDGPSLSVFNDNLLTARRLVEAGTRVVDVQYGAWDFHGSNFKQLRAMVPVFDQALATLIEDLDQRGMLDDVTIVVWGEFGRTPRVTRANGRDHWPQVMSALLAGGGMKTGQVIGSTDRLGGDALDRPVHLREIIATLYHNLGINAKATTIPDPNGRPQYLVDGRDPVRELVKA